MAAQMLIIIGSVAAGSVAAGSGAAVEAYECLKNLRDQRFGAATKHAGKACRLAKPVFQVWFPGCQLEGRPGTADTSSVGS
jgi:hypothetical protein